MPRFILIDNATGYIWGDTGDLDGPARQETPANAAKRLDETYNTFGHEYVEHGPNYRPTGNAYHVYRADINGSEAVPLVFDGQSVEEIENVITRCRKVAVIEIRQSEAE